MNGITIWETEHFVFFAPAHAHIPREDGGHLCVTSREKYFSSRSDFSPKEAIEVMRLTMLAGEAMIAGMKERGEERLLLEVRASNLPARTLYESIGFVCDGIRKRYYRDPAEDAVLMSLTLNESESIKGKR